LRGLSTFTFNNRALAGGPRELLIVPPALGIVGTLLYDVPCVGLATAYVPWYLPWLIVVAVVGAGIAIFSWLRRRDRFSAVLVILAVATLVGASVIATRMTATVERAGADIDLVETFGIGQDKWVPPDAEAIYSTFDGDPWGSTSIGPPDRHRAPPCWCISTAAGGSRATEARMVRICDGSPIRGG